jgi:catechol 2,3-dioxygenase-like lactoylglutathione lyase family enzyme
MASTDQSSEPTGQTQSALGVDMKLEVVTLPVSNVDRAKDFYQSLGWRLDADFAVGDDIRAVQLTPPQSGCSISFGKGLTTAAPGSAQRTELVVSDIEAAREDLISRGVEVSEVFHRDGGQLLPGPDPERRSYLSYASFSSLVRLFQRSGWQQLAPSRGHHAASGPDVGGMTTVVASHRRAAISTRCRRAKTGFVLGRPAHPVD